ncbi:MAG: glycosyltransferase family 25 protein, partial [Candidatus Paceibacterota bacterium]
SLNNLGIKNLFCYCVGDKCFNKITLPCNKVLIRDNDENIGKFIAWRTANWNVITFYKIKIIYENLLKHQYVCFTDSDIVYENDNFLKYCESNIENYDLLIQNDTDRENCDFELCTGFMYIKSNDKTKEIFNPANIGLNTFSCDKKYINNLKFTSQCKFKVLPLTLFPNGHYFYNNKDLKPILIHFNHAFGHEKKEKMLLYGKWLLTLPKIFVINMEFDTRRKKFMLDQFKTLNIVNYEFINAVDGRQIPDEKVTLINQERKKYFDKPPNDLKKGQIGCFLSHRTIYKKIVDQNLSEAIILEDDAQILDLNKLKFIIQHIKTIDANYDYLLLSNHSLLTSGYLSNWYKNDNNHVNVNEFINSITYFYGTGAQLISLKGAKNLYAFTENVFDAIDIQISLASKGSKISNQSILRKYGTAKMDIIKTLDEASYTQTFI